MGLAQDFANKVVFLDTAPLIYYIEENPRYEKILGELFAAQERYKYQFLSSVVTLLEVMVLPLRQKEKELAKAYQTILTNSPSITLVDVNVEIAKTAARLRADYALKTPDAIQLAAAVCYSADYFLTNDHHLKTVKEANVITLDDVSCF
ncbi:MAG: type II toxin-antitoxin system VapC family toxin [Prevotellaceae bacterium]|jgi:predicted nucleic acid-binding protein|nr:type II toxin-antitoxin system VapC family toxin [Prevotellaceae bacterium]